MTWTRFSDLEPTGDDFTNGRLALFLCDEHLGIGQDPVCSVFESRYRDHSSCINAAARVDRCAATSPKLQFTIREIRKNVEAKDTTS